MPTSLTMVWNSVKGEDMTIAKTQDVVPGTRDAFHVKCILVWSEEYVGPGDHIRFVEGSLTRVVPCVLSIRHGIVDPFTTYFKKGEKFWMLLNLSLTKNLRHSFQIEIEEPVDLSYSGPLVSREDDPSDFNDDGCHGCQS